MAAAALGADVSAPARAMLIDDDVVARACAGCALALTNDTIPEDAVAVLAEVITDADPTWAWRWRVGDPATTREMACVVLRGREIADPGSGGAGAIGHRRARPVRCGYARRARLPNFSELGVVLGDLDEVRLDALNAFGRVARGVRVLPILWRLGLTAVADIAALQDETPPFFAKAAIDMGGETPRWHVARAWRERVRVRVRDGISHQTAVE